MLENVFSFGHGSFNAFTARIYTRRITLERAESLSDFRGNKYSACLSGTIRIVVPLIYIRGFIHGIETFSDLCIGQWTVNREISFRKYGFSNRSQGINFYRWVLLSLLCKVIFSIGE